jgi:hypothetical protein
MQVTYNAERNRFEWRGAFGTHAVAKAAGFAFEGHTKTWHSAGYKNDRSEKEQALCAARLMQYADDSAKARIPADVLTAVGMENAMLENSRATDSDAVIPCPDGLAYLPFQKGGIAFARAAFARGQNGVLIADEMGLGKTIQGIGLSNDDASIRKVLVVCPGKLKINWAREWKKWCVKGLSIGVVVTKALSKKAMARLNTWGEGRVTIGVAAIPNTDVVIVNYDIIDRYLDAIYAVAWDLVLADEAHKLKNPKARRTCALLGSREWDKQNRVWNITQQPVASKRKAFLTGTPIVNRPKELWPFVLALDPEGLGKYKSKYEKRYCAAGLNTAGYYTADGASNLDELQNRLRKNFMVRRLKADVLKDLPAKRRQVIVLESDGLEDLMEREATEYSKLELNEGSDPASFTELSAVRKAVALAKVPFAIEHVEGVLENTNKVVIMAHHYEVVDAIKVGLAKYGVVGVDGRVTDITKIDAAVNSFQNDDSVRVFVGTIQAAGVGLTLTAASTVVFAELDWVPGNMSQAEDRCHRIGQLDNVLVQHLVLDGSVDANLVEKLIIKQAIIDKALDEKPQPTPVPVAEKATQSKPTTKPQSEEERVFTAKEITAIHSGLRRLASMCDGAHAVDGHGFNKLDTDFGRSLASARFLSQKQAKYGQRLVQKYQGQLDTELVIAAGITPMN